MTKNSKWKRVNELSGEPSIRKANNKKLEKEVMATDMRRWLKGKLEKKPRNKKTQTNIEKQTTDKTKKDIIRTIYFWGIEKCTMDCLEKRQQSSPAVMFARATQI